MQADYALRSESQQEVFNMTQEDIKGVRYYVLELRKEICIRSEPEK